ncbi:MAG: SDR family NAD(P)-dependent oxidoreductase, partial [Bacteroidota bacterium]|nr:SDR family NAD(P)-dependent oxidoreductase [Bacteroidota bacterium]
MNAPIKTAIVTGGASGLGLAITQKFAGNGVRTIMIGRNEKVLAAVAGELGGLCSYRVFDLGDLKGIPQLIAGIIEEYGTID